MADSKFFSVIATAIIVLGLGAIMSSEASAKTNCHYDKSTKVLKCSDGKVYRNRTWNQAIRKVKGPRNNGHKYRCTRSGIRGWCRTRKVQGE